MSDENINKVLTEVSNEEYYDTAGFLLCKGVCVNATDRSGTTSLMMASAKGYCDTAKVLLDGGADLNGVNIDGYTALMFATRYGHLNVVDLLIDRGALSGLRFVNSYDITAASPTRKRSVTN